ncbi:hypothetical protein PUN28_016085 [Cardiocondyla obscurior]|uniref:Uncharacterized protein n=1 Tax=Cardiocondyla obscurior TaxID=286306 RepID=A0AAW2EV74_9HYME
MVDGAPLVVELLADVTVSSRVRRTTASASCGRPGILGTRGADSWSRSACAARSAGSSRRCSSDFAGDRAPTCRGPSRSWSPRHPPGAPADTSTRTGSSRSSRQAPSRAFGTHAIPLCPFTPRPRAN